MVPFKKLRHAERGPGCGSVWHFVTREGKVHAGVMPHNPPCEFVGQLFYLHISCCRQHYLNSQHLPSPWGTSDVD